MKLIEKEELWLYWIRNNCFYSLDHQFIPVEDIHINNLYASLLVEHRLYMHGSPMHTHTSFQTECSVLVVISTSVTSPCRCSVIKSVAMIKRLLVDSTGESSS